MLNVRTRNSPRLSHKIILLMGLLLFQHFNAKAENIWRYRFFQAANLTGNVEQSTYKQGNDEYEMDTGVSKNNGLMVIRNDLGLGYHTFSTEIDDSKGKTGAVEPTVYKLDAKFYEIAYLTETASNSSITLGAGIATEGSGEIKYIYASDSLKSNDVTGFTGFIQIGLEYSLPVNLGFLNMKFSEFMLGYRTTYLEYKNYSNGSTKLSKSQMVNSSYFDFGLGFVF